MKSWVWVQAVQQAHRLALFLALVWKGLLCYISCSLVSPWLDTNADVRLVYFHAIGGIGGGEEFNSEGDKGLADLGTSLCANMQ